MTAFEGALHTLRTTFRLVATHKCETPASSRAGSFNGVTLVHESARMERMLTSVAPHIACYGMRAPEGLLKRCRQGIAENVVPFHIGGAEVTARKRREVGEAREDFRPYDDQYIFTASFF